MAEREDVDWETGKKSTSLELTTQIEYEMFTIPKNYRV
jgi:hypothetical protein